MERKAKLRDPELRKQLAHDAVDMPPGAAMEMVSKLPNFTVVATTAEKNTALNPPVARPTRMETTCRVVTNGQERVLGAWELCGPGP